MNAIRRTALAAALLAAFAGAAGAATETFEKAYSLEGVDRVRVENVNGRLDLTAWDRNYVRVTAVKSGTPSALENTVIRVTQPGSEIRVETVALHRPHLFSFLFGSHRLAKVEYQILLPAATPVRLETVNGSVHVQGRRAETRAETVNGSIDLRGITGVLHAETVNGRIALTRDDSDDTSLETVNGSIEAELPGTASFRYRLSAVNGSMEVGERRSRAHAIGIKSFEGDVNGGKSLVKAGTVNGSIRIILTEPPGAPAPVVRDAEESSSD
ncbi:MAG TPA: DUF4097 family beta strand repeat-containing protein [Thermoanaerobaculia bacterium]|nr:DUF4097 family beta strand repeat-containing protein [Thermoanaerobaculia bacterium]